MPNRSFVGGLTHYQAINLYGDSRKWSVHLHVENEVVYVLCHFLWKWSVHLHVENEVVYVLCHFLRKWSVHLHVENEVVYVLFHFLRKCICFFISSDVGMCENFIYCKWMSPYQISAG